MKGKPRISNVLVMKRVAIFDLGTNTFNLLISEENTDGSYVILVNQKQPVKLGEGKINHGQIIPEAYNRGIRAIEHHYQTVQQYKVDYIKAFGTSALRSARNGQQFLDEIYDKTTVKIEIISGDREAELIYKGVRQTIKLNNSKFLILDIGGGSNELIIADMHNIFWKKSYPLGIARLLEKFNPSDPLTSIEVQAINSYLETELQDLIKILKTENISILVGASGSFETFVSMINECDVIETEGAKTFDANEITPEAFNHLYNKLIQSTLAERKKMRGLEPMRIEMIVLASLFVKFILENHKFARIIQSNFALKEGAVFEILNERK